MESFLGNSIGRFTYFLEHHPPNHLKAWFFQGYLPSLLGIPSQPPGIVPLASSPHQAQQY